MILLGSPFFYLSIFCVGTYFLIPLKYRKLSVKVVYINIFLIIFFISLFDSLASTLFISKYNAFRTDNNYYHHGLKPYMNSKAKWDGGTERFYTVHTNSLGMVDSRVREITPVHSSKRVMFIGDSFTEGVGLPFEKTFAGIVANKLRKEGKDLLNAGVVSYSQKLYYLKTKYILDQGIKIDDLYIFVDISDIQDEIVYNYFIPDKKEEIATLHTLSLYFYQNSYIYRSWKLKFVYEQENPRNINSEFWVSEKNYYLVKPMWPYNKREFKKWGKEGLSLASKHMDMLFELCKKNSIKMHISVHPWPEQIRRRDLNSMHVNFWKDFAEKRSINFINLFPLFINEMSYEDTMEKYFIKGDVHWNENGHKIVSDRLIEIMNLDKMEENQ